MLKKFKGNDDRQLELVNQAAVIEHPFSLYFPVQTAASKLNWAWYKQTGDPDGLGVTFEYSDGGQSVRKQFRFEKNSRLFHPVRLYEDMALFQYDIDSRSWISRVSRQ